MSAFLSVREAAAFLGVSKSHAYRAIEAGTWPTPVVLVGSKKLIPAAALYALAAEVPGSGSPQSGAGPALSVVGERGDIDRAAS